MSVHFRVQGQSIVVHGKTYEHRELIKSLGGRFNSANKSWRLPASEENRERLRQLCKACGGGELPALVTETEDGTETTERPADVGGGNDEGGLTIAELLERANTALREKFPWPVWVIGEVQNLARKEHIYLQLAEAQEGGQQTLSVSAVIWRQQVEVIAARGSLDFLQDGLQVRCLCSVHLYRERGVVSLQVLDVDPAFTQGALAVAREKLLRELRATGQDRINKSLTMPRVPGRVGLITAAGSRAYGDFCDQLRLLEVPLQVIFHPAPMQGEEVLREVPQAIAALGDCDVIVITRGGGSASDLRWFDSAEVAAAIVASPVPIVAAIGHHEDLCVAEEISFMRQKTPTAAADYLASIFTELDELCHTLRAELAAMLQRSWQTVQTRYETISGELGVAAMAWQRRGDARLGELAAKVSGAAEEGIKRRQGYRAELAALLQERARQQVLRREMTLQEMEKHLLGLDPSPWLQKGWARIYGERGLLKSVKHAVAGEQVVAVMSDGRLKLQVMETEVVQTDKKED